MSLLDALKWPALWGKDVCLQSGTKRDHERITKICYFLDKTTMHWMIPINSQYIPGDFHISNSPSDTCYDLDNCPPRALPSQYSWGWWCLEEERPPGRQRMRLWNTYSQNAIGIPSFSCLFTSESLCNEQTSSMIPTVTHSTSGPKQQSPVTTHSNLRNHEPNQTSSPLSWLSLDLVTLMENWWTRSV